MHEMGIVQSIVDIIEEQARIHRAKRVMKISLEFGALTAVMPAAVQFAFEVLSRETVAEGAELDIRIIPLAVLCTECGKQSVLEMYTPLCPACESPALHIVQGRDEMRIASLEIEEEGQ
jgi:hydrogenase nickel incorporation protein HypA/HybF